jgi:hypothetical protein
LVADDPLASVYSLMRLTMFLERYHLDLQHNGKITIWPL